MTTIPGMPDVPVLRHLTWREAHLFEVGLWPGISLALAITYGEAALALTVVSAIRRRMQSEDQHREGDDWLKGYIRDAWYFGMGALTGLLIGAALVWILAP